MNLLGQKLPLYQMRGFSKTIKDGSLILIQTYYSVYVLDDTDLSGDYFARRTYIATHPEDYQFKIYPLKIRANTVAQVLSLIKEGKHFIDISGNIFKYKSSKVYHITCHPVVNIEKKGYNKYLLCTKVDQFSHLYFLTEQPSDFVQLINLGNDSFCLFDLVPHMTPNFRRKF